MNQGKLNHLVSIIIPHIWERALICLESLKKQTHRNIEIIVIVDNDQKGPGKPRNQGAHMARGEYLFFCDDDIILRPECIERMLEALERNPDASFSYCDYDKIGSLVGVEKSREWDPDFLMRQNYISTMSLIRKNDFPGFDEDLERYVDWDLWIRMATENKKGKYIPEVLFKAHFKSGGISVRGPVDRLGKTNILKKKHDITKRSYSIIIPVHNELEHTRNCLSSIMKYTGNDYEIIVVDDASTDGTPEYLETLGEAVTVIRNEEQRHHSKCCNQGINSSVGDYIILLNNDTIVSFHWNLKLRAVFDSLYDASCVGPLTSHAASCQELPTFKKVKDEINIYNIDGVQDRIDNYFKHDPIMAKITGFCFFTSLEMFNRVGLFDEDIPAGGNEAEWIIRSRKEITRFPYIATDVYIHHFGNASYCKENRRELWEKGKEKIISFHGEDRLNWLENELYTEMYKDFEKNLVKDEI